MRATVYMITINEKGHRNWYPSSRTFSSRRAAIQAAKAMTPIRGPNGEDFNLRVDVWACPEGGSVRLCRRVWSER